MPPNDHDDAENCPRENECPPCPPNIHPPPPFHYPPNNNNGSNITTPNLNSETYEPCNECKANIILAAIAALFFCCIVNLIICYVYFRCCANRRGRRVERAPCRGFEISLMRHFSWRPAEEHFLTTPPRDQGLCRAAVEALPVFVYTPESFEDGLQCAVCLSEFEEKEKGRVLPNCNHSFHVNCIDMWFYSHSTCPLCRAGVQPQPGSSNREVEISVREEGQMDSGEAASDGKAISSGASGSEEDQHNYSNNNECCVDVNMNDNLVEDASRTASGREN